MNEIMKNALEAAKTAEKQSDKAAGEAEKTAEKTEKKSITGILKDIFHSAASSIKSRKDGREAEKRLDDNKSISFKPKSLRYTYEDRANTDLNSKWKPADKNANPDDKLSPKGYFRPMTSKKINKNYDRSVENPDRLEDFYKTNKEFFKNEDEKNDTYNERRNISIDSTAIKQFDYDPKTQGLTVQFQGNSKKYFYPKVPVELIKKWIEANSKGEFFLSNIHDQYSMNPSHKHSTNVANKNWYKWFKKNYKGAKK